MIFVCDFFVISKRVYEKKISDLPLGSGWVGKENSCVAVSCRLPEQSACQASIILLYISTALPQVKIVTQGHG